MKTEIENIIYNYADELKIGGQSETKPAEEVCQFLQKGSTFAAKKVDLFN